MFVLHYQSGAQKLLRETTFDTTERMLRNLLHLVHIQRRWYDLGAKPVEKKLAVLQRIIKES